MHAAIVPFPGTNAEEEMIAALRFVCGAKITRVAHTERELPIDVDFVALPGGFSYGDYLRAGAIAKTAPILEAVRTFANRGGLVLGVCNGFQILVEASLLPGALLRNDHGRFDCRDIFVRTEHRGPFSPEARVLRLPIAHGEGRFHADDETMKRLEGEGRIAFRYADAAGETSRNANPNGSREAIAGLYGGPKKNILGLMPHPERMTEPHHGGTDGALLFRAALDSLKAP